MTNYNYSKIRYFDNESNDTDIRYTLGTGVANPLIVFGVNPSTATPILLHPMLFHRSR